jgi:hypothetical protein
LIGVGKFSPEIEKEINEKGYHILNTSLPPSSYPSKFPPYPKIKEIKVGNSYVIRLFVKIKSGGLKKIDSAFLVIKIIMKSEDDYLGEILTLLPGNFPLAKGQNIKIKREEILFEQK